LLKRKRKPRDILKTRLLSFVVNFPTYRLQLTFEGFVKYKRKECIYIYIQLICEVN